MKKTFYAVRIGRNPGIYESWLECEQQIKGFAGAMFKSFATIEEAQAFMHGISKEVDVKDMLEIYCDGSYAKERPEFATYGVVIVKNNEVIMKFNGVVDDHYNSNNITGEVFGVLKALKWVIKNNFKKIVIYHDYIGLSAWYDKSFTANTNIAKYYLENINKLVKDNELHINFIKVKGHSDNKWNDMADLLAKQALSKIDEYIAFKKQQ
ncbi:MAG: ribonuclease H family protein [Mycoplasmataceae bacterium]|nr:ribonuclease H family protein [Mycoplasmataceae bacterium]